MQNKGPPLWVARKEPALVESPKAYENMSRITISTGIHIRDKVVDAQVEAKRALRTVKSSSLVEMQVATSTSPTCGSIPGR